MTSHSLILPHDKRSKLRLIVLALLFVVGFHLVFQPFQMRFYDWDTKSIVLLGYALITAFVLTTSLFVLPKCSPALVSKVNSNVSGKFVWLSLNIFAIGVGFFLFKVLAGFYAFSLTRVGTGILATICVGAIPVGIFWLWNHKSKLRITDQDNDLILTPERGSKIITVKPGKLLYFEADGNYIQVVTQGGSQKLRCTMASIEDQLKSRGEFVRCHRAFVVRIASIKHIIKEAHNHFAILSDGSKIPISREKVQHLKSMLQTL